MLEQSTTELVLLAVGLMTTGIVSGLAAGLLGVGGGIVIVPVLYHLFSTIGIAEEVRMHIAVGTSLATIIATSASSVRAHWRRGAIDTTLLRQWGPWMLLGVVLGTAAAGFTRGPALSAVFATVAVVVSVQMGLGSPAYVLLKSMPKQPLRGIVATGIGSVSAMMGIGGGTLAVPILTLFNFPIHRAVGSASAFGFIIGVPGAIGFVLTGWNVPNLPPFSLGYLNLLGLALILPTSMLFAPVGARLAHRLNTIKLRRVFAIFLAVTAVRMFYALFA